MLFAAPANAAPEAIAEYGREAGQVWYPTGVAVDGSSGDFYVADRGNTRILKFDSAGNFLLAWGYAARDGVTPVLQTCGPEATPPTTECFPSFFVGNSPPDTVAADAIAVDSSSGAVYMAHRDTNRVLKFTSSGEFVFIVGRNVNVTKVGEGDATLAEKNLCTAVSGDTCEANFDSGSGPNEFTRPTSLAVDSSGTVWVGSSGRLSSFDPSGTAGAEFDMPGAGETISLELNSAGDFYVISELLPGVRKLEAGTGVHLETLDEAGFPRAVALDEADNVYVGDCGASSYECPSYHFKLYNPAGEQFLQFGAGEVVGGPQADALAVGESAERLYVASSGTEESNSAVQAFTVPAPGPLIEGQGTEEVLPTTATLTATINPEGDETTYKFEYGATESYGQTTSTETIAGSGFEPEDVDAQVAQLIPSTTYHFRVVASNNCNPSQPAEVCTTHGEDRTFTTPPAIDILGQWATDVTAHSSQLHAEMDPLGAEAEVWVEYGTTESYGQAVPLANLSDGFGAVSRQAVLTGLQAATTYHYRFVARDERDGVTYTVQGTDRTFTTQPSGIGFELADGRAWEMVSPPDKHGAKLAAITGSIQASADGEGLAYLSFRSIEAEPDGHRSEAASILARRGAGGSWSSKDIMSANDKVTPVAIGQESEFKLFSPYLARAILEPRTPTLLSSRASERTPYLRHNAEPPTFDPLVTGKEGFANVPPGTEFGGDPNFPIGSVNLENANRDLSHVVIRSSVPLAADAPAGALYQWTAGQLEPVSTLPAGEGGAIGSADHTGSGPGSMRSAVSGDGSRVFWSTGSYPNTTALYLRDTEADLSVRLDVAQPGAADSGTARPTFQGASADGTVVFFTDSRQLTAGASPSGFDLYRCEIPKGEEASGCSTLTGLSAPLGGSDESAEVQDIVAAIGEDGDSAYFVAKGVLDEVPNSQGDSAAPGQANLYLWQEGEGVRFIAALDPIADGRNWGEVSTSPDGRAASLSATGSPSGRYLAFMSQRSLTGYDNRGEASGEATQEIFRYDAVDDTLVCVSCNPSGGRPRAEELGASGTLPVSTSVDPLRIWSKSGIEVAALLPQATRIEVGNRSLYRFRAVLDNGRVFFNAIDSLVPADSNGQWDVYLHEPTGVGDCGTGSGGAAIARSAGGCVSLISSGTAEEEAAFLDASETGDDVFFLTSAQLNETDTDRELDVYDARVGGIPASLPEISECLGEACQPAARAPEDPTPASAAFEGPGNLAPRLSCGALSRRAGRLSRRAKALRVRARRATGPAAAKQLRLEAERRARRANGLSKRVERCRRASRRASR
jgi:NHL repeat